MKKRNNEISEFIKSTIILNKGILKNQLVVEEIGLPLNISKKSCRADIYCIHNNKVSIYEIKSCEQDFNTDFNKLKYMSYSMFCNYLYFVVPDSLYDYVYQKLFNSKDKEKNDNNKHIGIYTVSDKGYFKCEKNARNTLFINEKEIPKITDLINIQLKYRYYKFHENRFKHFKELKSVL